MTDLDYALLEKFRKADFFRNSKTVENFIQFSYKFLQDNPNHRDDVLEISKKIKKGCFERILEQREKEKTHVNASDLVRINMRSATLSDNYWNVIRLESLYVFESFIIAMERFRPPAKRFYNPRKMTLSTVVEDLQGLEDGKYKFCGLSMPSRTGKSTICLLFLSWIALKRPNSHNALGGHSGILARGFFKELLNFITSEEYAFKDLYEYHHPNQTILQDKSADEYTINLGSPDRFSTITCRGIDGTWTGAVDVSKDGYLYVDDLVRDREHSLSPVRMENTYQEYLNKMVDRKNDGARELMVGTRWSVEDPLGRIEARFKNDPQYFFRKIPALDENDNSNFNYTRNGFSSEYYIDMREKLDKAEWLAKFQQAPFVREGLTFPVEELRFFDGNVPDDEHRTLAAIDPAFGSGDSLSMPICMDFGDNFKFVIDWVHDSRTIAYTIPLIADKIEVHHITEIQIEKNRGGDLFADKLQKELDDRGIYFCKINLRNAPVKMSKEDKISGYSDFIKRHLQFLKPSKNVVENVLYRASDQYRKALDEMTMFSAEGRNPHDDAADAITQLAMMFELKKSRQATITRSWI